MRAKNKKIIADLGKMSVEEVFNKALEYGKEHKWRSETKFLNLWQESGSKCLFWLVQFELALELDEADYEHAIGSLGCIEIDDETGQVL